jgi:RNA polymerase primary sigma factor
MDHLNPVPYDYQHSAEFDKARPGTNKQRTIDELMPDHDNWLARKTALVAPPNVPFELAQIYLWPLLRADQERHLFRRMNYHKYRYNQIIQQEPTKQRFQDLAREANLVREIETILYNCNLRLVISLVKKRTPPELFWDAVSDSNMALLHAITKFNYSIIVHNKSTHVDGPVKFSTYATYAITRSLSVANMVRNKHDNFFSTGAKETLLSICDDDADAVAHAMATEAQHGVDELMGVLNSRERLIIDYRFGRGKRSPSGNDIWTLKELGAKLGITKERTRQISIQAMHKMLLVARARKKTLSDFIKATV